MASTPDSDATKPEDDRQQKVSEEQPETIRDLTAPAEDADAVRGGAVDGDPDDDLIP